MAKFPKEILVTKEKDADAEYLSARETVEEMDADRDANEEVGVYELVAVRRFKVTRELVPPLPPKMRKRLG